MMSGKLMYDVVEVGDTCICQLSHLMGSIEVSDTYLLLWIRQYIKRYI